MLVTELASRPHRFESTEVPMRCWDGCRLMSDYLDAELSERERSLEALKGDRTGQHSIRINQQWRICFTGPQLGPRTWRSSTITRR